MNHQILTELKQQVKERIDLSNHITDDQLNHIIEEIVLNFSERHFITSKEKLKLVKRIFHSFRGLDVLHSYIEDPDISEIMVNGHAQIFIEKKGVIELVDDQFESDEKLEDVIQTIVSKVNRVVNRSSPIVDARLQDGSRVHVVLPPASLVGPAITIRKFPLQSFTMEKLIEIESITSEVAQFLKALVESRYNIFISGGTGSGKTTFLNALSTWIPKHERIISIEDSAELRLDSILNLVRLETRNANTEGKGVISIRDLIRASLRMRPDRIIVGEVRGAEAFDMLQAMNTGHDGSLSTAHSNTCRDMLNRLETMVLCAVQLPLEAIRSQIGSAIEIMIHLSRMRDGTRRVSEIHEMIRGENNQLILNPLFIFKETFEESNQPKLKGKLEYTGNVFHNVTKLQIYHIDKPEWLKIKTVNEKSE